MKNYALFLGIFFSVFAMAQHKTGENVTVSDKINDDAYLAGETIRLEAPILGDLVVAGGNITVRDTVYQDLLIAGGEIIIKGYVADDIRAAGGTLTIDSEIGDDVIIAGGEVLITEDAVIHGNLINFSGDIEMNGKVDGMIKSYSGDLAMNGTVGKDASLFGGDLFINGEIKGTSKIGAEEITIGEKAIFRGDVTYWSEDGNVDFKNSLKEVTATFDENLIGERKEFSWKGFGIAALGFWVFYLFSAFLVLLLLNWAFSDFFSATTDYLDENFLKSLGYGTIYIIGLPLLIILMFITLIGIPIGLFFGTFYIFSILFGHLLVALLFAHYLNRKSDKGWNFWTIVLLSLGIALVIRLLTFIPFLGTLISFVILAVAYGLVSLSLMHKKAALKLRS